MKKIGRPKLEVTRDILVGARFTAEECRYIDKAVGFARKTRSEWIRGVLLGAAGVKPAPVEEQDVVRPVAFDATEEDFLD